MLLVPVAELSMRLCNVGRNVNLVTARSADESQQYTHQLNPLADLAFYGSTDLGGPEPRPFRLPKPDNTYRIVFLGGSTVIGFPYPPELAFPRHVELLLEQQDPDTDYEVLNAGVTSLNSFAVADLAEQCLAANPDLIVVHTGHNEFYGPGGPASTAFNLSPTIIRSTYRFRRWRFTQLLASALPAQKPLDDDLLNVLPSDLQIPLDSPIVDQARANLLSNLTRIRTICQAAGVPVMFTTVASNIRNQSPMRSIWPTDATARQKDLCSSLIRSAESLTADGNLDEALQQLLEATSTCPGYALAQYRLAECYQSLEQHESARKAFYLARDLDACRFRAPGDFRQVVEDVASQAPECWFVDTASQLEAAAHPAGPGYDLFLEHVHYNQAGHRLLGRILAMSIHTLCLRGRWNENLVPDSQNYHELLGLIPEDEIASLSFAIQVLQTGPFEETADRDRHQDFLQSQIAELWAQLPEFRQNAFADLQMNQISADLPGELQKQHLQRNHTDFAQKLQEIGTRRRPWQTQNR